VTATITALRGRRGRVVVELDGAPWRTLPAEAVVQAGLSVGITLERERVRTLARALRSHRAREVALRALSRRDRSRAELEQRLTDAGVRPTERGDALDRASRAGLVDDSRFAAARARTLAERGAGDRLVLDDLARRGVEPELARAVVSELEPESERAARVVATRGRSVRTLRYLASRGFGHDSLDELIAELENGALP
jgi:regulatory protein